MQVVEKSHEGLSRSYAVTIPAAELGAALDARIAEIIPTLNLRGFRPGKVPAAHVRRLYGKSLMGEVIDKTLNETSQKVLSDNQLRVAAQPDLKPVSDMDKVLAGGQDLAFDLDVEVMPDFEPADVSAISVERLVYEPADAEVDAELTRLAEMNRTYEARAAKAPAQDGDQVLVDFIGSIDGVPFEGGAADDAELVLGSDQFIPGFEAQLVGAKAGSALEVKVEFPADYQVERLAGKPASFEVKVKEVREPKAAAADDALGARLGLTDLAGLRAAIKSNMEREYAGASRFKLKRALLDALDERHDIPLPPRMVEAEFDAIWRQVEKDQADGEVSPEDADKDEATLRAEYGKIAERRVRLGLVLAEVGRRANVQVSDAELGDAMRAEAMRYGEQAQQVFEMMRNNANLQSQMRAPLYEEKVVDHIIALAKVADRAVSKEELLREDDLPAGFSGSNDETAKDTKPNKAARKAAPKAKASAKAEAETAPAAADEPPAAKAPLAAKGPKAAKAAKAEPAPAAEAKPARKPAAKPKAKPQT